MSLPTIEPLPDENASLPPARRRRQRRMLIPPGSDERAEILTDLARQAVPSFDFFLFSLISGLALGIALLLDSPALVVLAALLAPFMAPMLGISLGTITGSLGFVLQSFGSLGIGSLIVFLCGALAGWAVPLLPEQPHLQAAFLSHFTWPGFLLLALGAGLTSLLVVRDSNQKPLVSSVAIAYALYLPIGTAGFGLSSGIHGLWPDGLVLFFVHFVWATLVGMLVLGVLGIRPLNNRGYTIGGVYALAGIALVWALAQAPLSAVAPFETTVTPETALAGETRAVETLQPALTATPTASVTPAPTGTFTPTLVPTLTTTLTITPSPTPVLALIHANEGGGALIREEPNYDAVVIQSILNETEVEVIAEPANTNGVFWVYIRTPNGTEGWIVQSLIRTLTPIPTE